ncbi:MAG: hypothetical protein ACK452_13250 [Bacteroidota bacterium]|jgi:hypothetical protein
MNVPPKILLMIHLVMAAFIMAGSMLLFFTDVWAHPGQGLLIENPNRSILAFIFLFYSIYRFIRGWQIFKAGTIKKNNFNHE